MSPTATAEVSALDVALADLHQRMAGKSSTEQTSMLAEFAEKQYGAKKEDRAPVVMLTGEQLSRIMGGSDEAQKVADEAAAKATRKFHVPAGDAKAQAEDVVSKEIRKGSLRQNDMKVCAEVFRNAIDADFTLGGSADNAILQSSHIREIEAPWGSSLMLPITLHAQILLFF